MAAFARLAIRTVYDMRTEAEALGAGPRPHRLDAQRNDVGQHLVIVTGRCDTEGAGGLVDVDDRQLRDPRRGPD